ncbi:hypothetical protein Q0P02_14255, partial [Staphylococcus aureus]|nr:hypothetical protein [Staphylococcus aureus]
IIIFQNTSKLAGNYYLSNILLKNMDSSDISIDAFDWKRRGSKMLIKMHLCQHMQLKQNKTKQNKKTFLLNVSTILQP